MNQDLKIEIEDCQNLEDLMDLVKKESVKAIIFGETHGIIDELPIQEILISLLKPSCYLYELLEENKLISDGDFEEFFKRDDLERFSFISSYADLKPTVFLARKHGLPIIGCDIQNMLRESENFLEGLNLEEEDKIMNKREERQNQIIKDSIRKYNRPIFVSLGAYHIRDKSPSLNDLSDFLLVFPQVNGMDLDELPEDFEPSHIKEISYVVKLIRK